MYDETTTTPVVTINGTAAKGYTLELWLPNALLEDYSRALRWMVLEEELSETWGVSDDTDGRSRSRWHATIAEAEATYQCTVEELRVAVQAHSSTYSRTYRIYLGEQDDSEE